MLEPLKNAMGNTMEVQPATVNPVNLLMSTKSPIPNATKKLKNPNHRTIRIGKVEKEVTPQKTSAAIYQHNYRQFINILVQKGYIQYPQYA